jgi:hypothetical protein
MLKIHLLFVDVEPWLNWDDVLNKAVADSLMLKMNVLVNTKVINYKKRISK